MRRSFFYRAYTKELINYYLNLIILIQVDRQSESAILWINLTLGASPSPSPTGQRAGQAPRGREPQKQKVSGKE